VRCDRQTARKEGTTDDRGSRAATVAQHTSSAIPDCTLLANVVAVLLLCSRSARHSISVGRYEGTTHAPPHMHPLSAYFISQQNSSPPIGHFDTFVFLATRFSSDSPNPWSVLVSLGRAARLPYARLRVRPLSCRVSARNQHRTLSPKDTLKPSFRPARPPHAMVAAAPPPSPANAFRLTDRASGL
jgi:hypothetical protein